MQAQKRALEAARSLRGGTQPVSVTPWCTLKAELREVNHHSLPTTVSREKRFYLSFAWKEFLPSGLSVGFLVACGGLNNNFGNFPQLKGSQS